MKIKTIEQVLDLVQTLNKVHDSENVRIDLRITGIESDEDIKKLAVQEKSVWHTPCAELPYVWAGIKLGNIDCTIIGVEKKVNVTFN